MDVQRRHLHQDDLPVGALTPSEVSTARRWLADPLPLLLLVGGVGVALAVLATATGAPAGADVWVVPALFAVVVAGLALSGST